MAYFAIDLSNIINYVKRSLFILTLTLNDVTQSKRNSVILDAQLTNHKLKIKRMIQTEEA